MRIKEIHLTKFKRFTDLKVQGIPESARLVVLVGPSGCGKSSLIEGVNLWAKSHIGASGAEFSYYNKAEDRQEFADLAYAVKVEPHSLSANMSKSVYVRSAYRHSSQFNIRNMEPVNEDESRRNMTPTLIAPDAEAEVNYRRVIYQMVNDVFDPEISKCSGAEIADRVVGEIRKAVKVVFDDLELLALQNPNNAGTFYFRKGAATRYDFKNLSGGEKAAFDLLLDFLVKKEIYSDTIICIDEPEVHIGLAAQGRVLKVIYRKLPPMSQLWLATHSIGILREAQRIAQTNPGEVVFLDFDRDFDKPEIIVPEKPSREFWERLHGHVLDDIAGLMAPESVVVCESEPGKDFDAKCYNRIFAQRHPNVLFVSAGGKKDLRKHSLVLSSVIKGADIKILRDGDKMSTDERKEKHSQSERVLSRPSIESYLLDGEVLTKFCTENNIPEVITANIEAVARNFPKAAGKREAGEIYQKVRDAGIECGSSWEYFLRDFLAPLINEEMSVFQELENDIFGEVAEK